MLNSVDPEAAVAFYLKAFASTKRATWGGYPAILSPTDVLILFNKVATPPDSNPLATAYWHFGWNPPDQRAKVEQLQAQGYKFAPLWTGIGDGSVVISSDTFPGAGGIYGLDQSQRAVQDAFGVKNNRRLPFTWQAAFYVRATPRIIRQAVPPATARHCGHRRRSRSCAAGVSAMAWPGGSVTKLGQPDAVSQL